MKCIFHTAWERHLGSSLLLYTTNCTWMVSDYGVAASSFIESTASIVIIVWYQNNDYNSEEQNIQRPVFFFRYILTYIPYGQQAAGSFFSSIFGSSA